MIRGVGFLGWLLYDATGIVKEKKGEKNERYRNGTFMITAMKKMEKTENRGLKVNEFR